jgi:hypothetical protein
MDDVVARSRSREALAVRLEWEAKPTQVERLALPFQTEVAPAEAELAGTDSLG